MEEKKLILLNVSFRQTNRLVVNNFNSNALTPPNIIVNVLPHEKDSHHVFSQATFFARVGHLLPSLRASYSESGCEARPVSARVARLQKPHACVRTLPFRALWKLTRRLGTRQYQHSSLPPFNHFCETFSAPITPNDVC